MKRPYEFLYPVERHKMDMMLFKVCAGMEVPMHHILNSQRGPSKVIDARHVAMFAFRARMDLSYPVIGCYFNRDHTSVMHAIRRVQRSNMLLEHYASIFSVDNSGDNFCITRGNPVRKLVVKDLSPIETVITHSIGTPYPHS